MPLAEIKLPRKKARARELYEVLREAILDGTLRAGERLVEENVAEIASVSRTPVREALGRLETERLVQFDGRGIVVVEFTAETLAEMGLIREVLEGLASSLAAASRTELDLLTLEEIMNEWDGASSAKDVDRLVVLNHAFHETIWRAAGNRYLSEKLHNLREFIELRQDTTLGLPGRFKEAKGEHEGILLAIRDKDEEKAEELTRIHFRRALALRVALRRSSQQLEASRRPWR